MRTVIVEKSQSPESAAAVSRAPEVVFCSVSDGGALLNLSRGVYFGLDAVGTRIWELLQTPRSAEQLTDALMMEYDVSAERCRKSVAAFLEKMSEQDLIRYETAVAHE